MTIYYNPAAARAGIYIEPWLLARKRVSAEAKIIYAALAIGAQPDGTTLVEADALPGSLGISAQVTRERLAELSALGLLRVERLPDDLLRCRFLAHRWMRSIFFDEFSAADADERAGGGGRDRGTETFYQARSTRFADEPARSRHSLAECREFVLWCKEQGEDVRTVGGLAYYIHRGGYRDDEITRYLAERTASGDVPGRSGEAEWPAPRDDSGAAIM